MYINRENLVVCFEEEEKKLINFYFLISSGTQQTLTTGYASCHM